MIRRWTFCVFQFCSLLPTFIVSFIWCTCYMAVYYYVAVFCQVCSTFFSGQRGRGWAKWRNLCAVITFRNVDHVRSPDQKVDFSARITLLARVFFRHILSVFQQDFTAVSCLLVTFPKIQAAASDYLFFQRSVFISSHMPLNQLI